MQFFPAPLKQREIALLLQIRTLEQKGAKVTPQVTGKHDALPKALSGSPWVSDQGTEVVAAILLIATSVGHLQTFWALLHIRLVKEKARGFFSEVNLHHIQYF